MHNYYNAAASHDQMWAIEKKLAHLRIENWLYQDLFSWQWFLLVAALFIPWIIWYIYVDKKRFLEISLFGTIVLIISSYLDATVTPLGLWSYHYWVVPLWPRLISADFSIIPVTFMFVYQRFISWKEFVFAMIIVSIVFSFIGEPFLNWIDVYQLHGWRHIYSFPIYILIGLFVKWLVHKLANKDKMYSA